MKTLRARHSRTGTKKPSQGARLPLDTSGKRPHCYYFGWTQGNPIAYIIRFILFGEGDTAPVTHEVIREAEPDLGRPIIHIGGDNLSFRE